MSYPAIEFPIKTNKQKRPNIEVVRRRQQMLDSQFQFSIYVRWKMKTKKFGTVNGTLIFHLSALNPPAFFELWNF